MSSGVLESIAGTDERERILAALADRLEELAEDGAGAIRREIPAYAACDERVFADVRAQVELHYRVKLQCMARGEEASLDDLLFTRSAAMRRARAGFALEDYLNAFRVGQRVFWDALLAVAGPTPAGQEAALSLVGPLMRFVDVASTHAARVYVDFQEHLASGAVRQRRDLLELLLDGRMPPCGPLQTEAAAHGISEQAQMLVAVAVPVAAGADGDASRAGAAIARAGLGGTRALVVAAAGEIVAVAALGPTCDAERACELLTAVHERLRREGMPLAVGISTVAEGLAELPRAHADARAALECVARDGGLIALPRLSALEYLALRADGTAQRLVDPTVREFLREDRERGGTQADTIRALAAADLRLADAAERLQIHPNTMQYRLRRIAERSGRNPRHVADLVGLLVAIALEDRLAA
jgi:PucR C-terminal helix-turn-helix domain/GGDEF-like domain